MVRTHRTIVREQRPHLPRTRDTAVRLSRGVQRHDISRLIIGLLNDIHLSRHRPDSCAHQPESRPRPTDIGRQMLHIQDKQTMRVGLHALQANRLAAQIGGWVEDAGGVDAPAGDAGVADFGEVEEIALLGYREGDVVNEAEGWVEAFVESEAALEEVQAFVGVQEVEGLGVSKGSEVQRDTGEF